MSLQIANPAVVTKIEQLASKTGLSTTAAIEQAVEKSLREIEGMSSDRERIAALLRQIDQIPDQPNPIDPIEWDADGLPR